MKTDYRSFMKKVVAVLFVLGLGMFIPGLTYGQEAEPVNTVQCPVYSFKIIKVVDSSIAAPGSIITYTIRVSNIGTNDAENVLVDDGIPSYTTYVPQSATMGGVYSDVYNQLGWEIPSLRAGFTVEMQYKAQIDPDTPDWTEIKNTAKIAAPDILYSNLVITKVRIPVIPRLGIIKEVDKVSAYPGETLTYTMTVSNTGNAYAKSVHITDEIPAYTAFIPSSIVGGGTYTPSSNSVDWILDALAPGASVDLGFRVSIDDPTPGGTEIVNVGTIVLTDSLVSDTAKTMVLSRPKPILEIDKQVDMSSAHAGETLTYTLTVSNSGDAVAEDVTILDYIPDHTSYIPNSATAGGNYDDGDNSITWNIGSLEPLGSVDLNFEATIDVRTPAQTEIQNIGSIVLPDSLVSDTVYTTVTAYAGPRLFVEKNVDMSTAYAGETLTYTIIVWNGGDVTAEDIDVVDDIPEHTIYFPGSAVGGSYNASENRLSWTIDYLEPYGETYLSFQATIEERTPAQTTIVNTAEVVSPGEPDSDDAITTVIEYPGPRLYIEKNVDKASTFAGDTLTYTLIVWNGGEVDAENISVVDEIPEHAVYIPGTAVGGSYNPGQDRLSWTIDYLESHQETYLSFQVYIEPSAPVQTTIVNIAEVESPGPPDTDDATTIVEPKPEPILHIDKQVDKSSAYAGDLLSYTLIVSNGGEVAAKGVEVVDTIPEFATYVPGSASGGIYDAGNDLLSWTIEYLAPGEEVSLNFDASIKVGTPGQTEIMNIGSIVLEEGFIADTVKTTVIPSPGPILSITKEVDLASAYASDILTYTLSVSNVGDVGAEAVNVFDYIPDYTTYVENSATSGGVYNDAEDRLDWTVNVPAHGLSPDMTFMVMINSDTPAQTNIRNIGSIVIGDELKSDTAYTMVMETPEPVLHIDKQVDKSSAYAGDLLSYTLIVSNSGEVEAEGVEVVDTIPEFATYIPGSATGGNYDAGNDLLSWTIEYLAPGEEISLNFDASIDIGTPGQTEITNIGSIVIEEGFIADTVRTTVIPSLGPILSITKEVDLASAYDSDILTYTLSVSNVGDVGAEEVNVFDYIPDYTSYVENSVTSGGVYNDAEDRLDWTVNVPAHGSSPDMTFMVMIDNDTPAQTNIMNIGSIVVGDELKSDTAYTIVVETPVPTLDISKNVDKQSAFALDTLYYSLTIANNSEISATEINVVDNVPEYSSYIPGSIYGPGTYDADTERLSWNIDILEPGSSTQIGFMAIVDDIYEGNVEITNIGSIVFPDSLLSDTAKTEILPGTPDIRIKKYVDQESAFAGDILSYDLRITNEGNGWSGTVLVSDVIPEHTAYVTGSVTGGGIYNSNDNSLNWTFEALEPGALVMLSFRAEIDPETVAETEIINIGSVIHQESIRSDTVKTIVMAGPEPELSIDKQVDLASAYSGDVLTYVLTITNNGLRIPGDITVVDAIPEYTSYVSGSLTGNGTYEPDNNQITWVIDGLESEESVDVTFQVEIESEVPPETQIINTGMIISPGEPVSDIATTIVLPKPEPRLEIIKQVDSLVASPGSVLTYSFKLANISEEPLKELTVWDNIPEFSSYVPGSATSEGIYNDAANQVRWDWLVGSIAPGHNIELSFKVKINTDAPKGAQVINIGSAELPRNAVITGRVGSIGLSTSEIVMDTVHSNPVITVVDIKTGEDDLAIFKEVSDKYTAPRNILTYTVTVSNTGEEMVNNVTFSDTIPDLTSYIPGSATGDAVYDGTENCLTWVLGPLEAGNSEKFRFDVRVDNDALDNDVITNQAFITHPIPIAGNIVTTTVLRRSISVAKSVDKFQVTKGDTLTYTITYSNESQADIDNVIIADTLAAGLVYIAGSGGLYNPVNNTIIWRVGTVPAGESGTVNFRAYIDESVENQQEIENFVILTGDDIPIDTSNLVIVTILFPEAILNKTADPVLAIPGDTISYTVTAYNDGAGPLNDAVLIDQLPDGFAFIDGSARLNGVPVTVTGGNPISIPVGDMDVAASVEITYDVEVSTGADRTQVYVNSALLRGTGNSGRTLEFGPVEAIVSLETPRLTVNKTAGVASSTAGSFVPFRLVITNLSNITVDNITVHDIMPGGFFYVNGSSTIDGVAVPDPSGSNPYQWFLGSLSPGASAILQYTSQLGTSVPPGTAENTAWAQGQVGGESVRSAKSIALVNVMATTIPGTIRGKVIVDCDGDGLADVDSVPVGTDIYLDDGSQSKVNEKGMFYFSTVRAGEHVVALDVRDLDEHVMAKDEDASVFVYVHEGGESYITFRICPDYPRLDIAKTAAALPKVKVTKIANFDNDLVTDSNGVAVDYEIIIQTSGGEIPDDVYVVDSFPKETGLIVHENELVKPSDSGRVLKYRVSSPGEQKLTQSVYYSFENLEPNAERFLTNRFYIEGGGGIDKENTSPIRSKPAELIIGPFGRVLSREMKLRIIAAHFQTAKADLWPCDLFILADLADSIMRYPEVNASVEGHADYRPIHNAQFPSNWELSEARAKSVVSWFVRYHGIDSTLLKYKGFAATRPIDPGHTEESWQKNRRTEVIMNGRTKGGIKFNGDIRQIWSSSTMLELKPTEWDTLLTENQQAVSSDLLNSWEVLITIDNIGPGDASGVIINDKLPSGVIYDDGSAMIDGRLIPAHSDKDGNLIIEAGAIEAGRKAEVRYRIHAIADSGPVGGGNATITLKRLNSGTIEQESNSVLFE